ncbi:MAG: hypothetical protein J0H94_14110, partial [Rhizobiales bacterium]|nr:hypothetical protein [Hyphomicrobiales bacterium]
MKVRTTRFEIEVSRPALTLFIRIGHPERFSAFLEGNGDGMSVVCWNGKAVWPRHMRDDYVPAAAAAGPAFAELTEGERRGWAARDELDKWRRH